MLRDIEVTEVGMDCVAFSHGYGAIPDERYSIEAIRGAYEAGCTFFDTAEVYGPNPARSQRRHNECIVGKTLSDVRDGVVIATKLFLDAGFGGARPRTAGARDHFVEVFLKLILPLGVRKDPRELLHVEPVVRHERY